MGTRSAQVRDVLSSFLEKAQKLCIVVFSREQIYESFGSCKCVNFELRGLPSAESVQLFLKRIHRPLRPRDLVRGAKDSGNVPKQAAEARLASHPLMGELAGNPGRIRDSCQYVTPHLDSVFDLYEDMSRTSTSVNTLVRAMSVDEQP